jgi:plastocyanin
MSARRSVAVVALAVAASVGQALPAHALVPQQIVTVESMFLPGDLVILQGDTLTLTNADLATHDVTALDTVGGVPLFRSATIGPGKQSNVAGVPALEPSVYPFFCSVHEFMTGTITVLAVP